MTEHDNKYSEAEALEDAFESISYQARVINDQLLRQIIEGILLAAGRPMTLTALGEIFLEAERPNPESIRAALRDIETDCQSRGFELKEVASGFRFQVRQQLSPWI